MSKLSSKRNQQPNKAFKRGFGQRTQFSQNAQHNTYLYTKGREYTDSNGNEYVGEYHITKNGRAFTGPIPLDQEKNKAVQLYDYYESQDTFVYDRQHKFYTPLKDHAKPKPHQFIVRPEDGDYKVGYAIRYFVQKFNNSGYAIEIDKTQRESYGSALGIDSNLYQVIDIQWQLTGTLQSIEENNKKRIQKGNAIMAGLALAVSNFTQYAQPNNNTATPNVDSLLVNPKLNSNSVPLKQTFNKETGNII